MAQLSAAVSAEVRRLHDAGIYSRDLQETNLMVEQSGDAVLWMFKMPVAITYEVTESPPDRLDPSVSWPIVVSTGPIPGTRTRSVARL